MPFVSIAMATYNGERYLAEQLQSIARQTRPPDELVIVDDASTDRTMELLRAFQVKSRFSVLIKRNAENVGVTRNFERVLSLCTGDVIFMSDQDDVWFPDKIHKVLAAFARQPGTQVVLNDQIIANEDLVPAGETKLGRIRRLGLNDDAMITGCCTAIRRGWRDLCLPFPAGDPTHDGWIGFAATTIGVRTIVDEPLQMFRRHGANASRGIVNDTGALGLLRFAFYAGSSDVLGRLASEVAMLQALLARLKQHGPLGNWSDDSSRAFTRLASDRLARTEQRIGILSSRQPARTFGAISFFFRGGYDYDHGWRSAASDLLRRTRRPSPTAGPSAPV